MFSDRANLRGVLATGEPLKVSDVVHKAVIEFDEMGSEATAGSGTFQSQIVHL